MRIDKKIKLDDVVSVVKFRMKIDLLKVNNVFFFV